MSAVSILVAPFVGAWIETSYFKVKELASEEVAPFVGAWIETDVLKVCVFGYMMSLPSWERGLKLYD